MQMQLELWGHWVNNSNVTFRPINDSVDLAELSPATAAFVRAFFAETDIRLEVAVKEGNIWWIAQTCLIRLDDSRIRYLVHNPGTGSHCWVNPEFTECLENATGILRDRITDKQEHDDDEQRILGCGGDRSI